MIKILFNKPYKKVGEMENFVVRPNCRVLIRELQGRTGGANW